MTTFPGWPRIVMLSIAALTASVVPAAAQETVSLTVPSIVSFDVIDVSRSTSGMPNPSTISFSNANLTVGKALRVSVRADAAVFTSPGGANIPAANVSWTASGFGGGLGSNGTLSSTSFTEVFRSSPATSSGQVDLAWTLAAPGSGIRAGQHQLTIRWKVESITP
jgi:hypothetical protein